MNRKVSSTVLMAASIGILLGCGGFNHLVGPQIKGSGNVKTESRQVAEFTKISIEGAAADLRVTVGPQTSVVVEAEDNILPVIETVVHDSLLEIGSNQSYSTSKGVRVTITTPNLEALSISGSSDSTIDGVNGDSFSVAIAGSGQVRASGSAKSVRVNIDGSGDVDLRKLSAEKAKVAIAGSGDIKINASDTLDASVAGSGDIFYSGNPKHVSKSVAGSGSVRAAN